MKLPAYPKYKPSGVEWLGDVPDRWDAYRIKYIASTNDDKLPETTPGDYEIEYIDIGSVNRSEGIVDREQMVFEDAPSRARRIVRDGDTIVSTVRTYLKAIAPIRKPNPGTIVSTGFAVLRPQNIQSKYLSYALRDERFVNEVVARSVGVSYPACNASDIGDIVVSLPSIEEQTAIANFLDRETAKLDTLISKQRELIERLQEKRRALISRCVTRGLPPEAAQAAGLDPHPKLKPSGVEWLGDVPEHWDTPPLYSRYDQVLGKMLDQNKMTGEHPMPYIRNVDVQWDKVNTSDLPYIDISPDEEERFTIHKNDLLICEGGEVGRTAIWNGESGTIAFQKAIHRLRPYREREVVRFFFYTMCFATGMKVFLANSNPNTIPHLTGEQLRLYRFPRPSADEQTAIANFLDRETAKIDALISKKRELIERLQEYRTALITAAVTGKIDVREAATDSDPCKAVLTEATG